MPSGHPCLRDTHAFGTPMSSGHPRFRDTHVFGTPRFRDTHAFGTPTPSGQPCLFGTPMLSGHPRFRDTQAFGTAMSLRDHPRFRDTHAFGTAMSLRDTHAFGTPMLSGQPCLRDSHVFGTAINAPTVSRCLNGICEGRGRFDPCSIHEGRQHPGRALDRTDLRYADCSVRSCSIASSRNRRLKIFSDATRGSCSSRSQMCSGILNCARCSAA